ncbi:MAG: hypothetical protein OEW13_09970 [Nitrospira sp.]|nr:hypothetical protein [Nitrospira sp.]
MTRTGVTHARLIELRTTSCLVDEAAETVKSDAQGGSRTHIASTDFDTSREPGLRHETEISRSTVRQRVTRYSRKRSTQRPEA